MTNGLPMQRICVYCGSNTGARPVYADAARELADVLVRHDLELVYGGSAAGTLSLIHISEPTRLDLASRIPSSA